MRSPFSVDTTPDWQGFLRCIRREGAPQRVHYVELFLDPEVQQALCDRYGVAQDLDKDDPAWIWKRQIAIQSFLGYDFIRCGAENVTLTFNYNAAEDTASTLRRDSGRQFMDENRGPITSWPEFESYPWPKRAEITTRALEWYERNLPDGMCIVAGGGFGHFAEHLSWLMGYATLCMALCEQRDLARAIYEKVLEQDIHVANLMVQFDCVKALWGSDDMGFRGGPLISPEDLRNFVLPGHKALAAIAQAHGRPYLLHSCGNLELIMDDLIDDVKIDAKHSFEDTIEDVRDAKRKYGGRIALLGGIDLDFLCRSDEAAVRRRVRDTLEICMPGGGYCLGTGNSVANYIPLDNYIAMLDEGRRFA